jgi:hypothetical protein
MSDKRMKTRIVHKHAIESDWAKAINFIPLKGEFIVYDVDENYSYERIKIGDGVQNVNDLPFAVVHPDWNQNDEANPAYVQNRPFWTDDPVETELVTKTTVDFTMAPALENPFAVEFVVGQTYLVTWDDVEYECISYITGGAIAIGNGSIAGMSGGSNEPFLCGYLNDTVMLFSTEPGSHTISITSTFSKVHKIDAKYLPDNALIVTIVDQLEDGTFVASHSTSEILAAENEGKTIVFYDNDGIKYVSDCGDALQYYFKYTFIWYEESTTLWICIYEDKTVEFSDDRYVPTTERITAQVGQAIVVEEINESGQPIAWRAIDRHRFEAVTLIDELNGYEYILSMRGGKLASICRTDEITVLSMPIKKEYLQGELFDPTGMVVMATRQDGSKYEVDMSTYIVPVLETPFTVSYVEADIAYTATIDLTVNEFDPSVQLVDFNYNENDDGTYYITGWKGTLNGVPSTELVVPNSSLVKV